MRPPVFEDEPIPEQKTHGFPPPQEPGADRALADLENYAPPPEEKDNIVCFRCKHFFYRKHIALSWSTRPAGKKRLEGKALCTSITPALPLLGEYITSCTQFEAKEIP